MITLETIYKGGFRTEVTHVKSGTRLLTDAPVDNQGKGESFSPTDLLAASLGSCMLTIMGQAAKVHNFDIDGTSMKTTKVMGTNPRRVVEIIIELTFPHDNYSAKERKIIEAAANECPAARSLHPDLKQTLIFLYGK